VLARGRNASSIVRKKRPVRRRAVPGRALYPEFLLEGTRLRSVKSGKALYPGSALSGKNIHCSYGLCPRDRGEIALKAGKRYIRGAFYLSSTVPTYGRLAINSCTMPDYNYRFVHV